MKGFSDGAESFLELLLPAVSELKRELECNSFGLKRVIVAWEGPLLRTCTWTGDSERSGGRWVWRGNEKKEAVIGTAAPL